jgi:hypothetical protein
MNSLQDKATWDALAERLRYRFSKLSEIDTVFMEGRHEEMMEKIGLKLGRSKEDIQKLCDQLNY